MSFLVSVQFNSFNCNSYLPFDMPYTSFLSNAGIPELVTIIYGFCDINTASNLSKCASIHHQVWTSNIVKITETIIFNQGHDGAVRTVRTALARKLPLPSLQLAYAKSLVDTYRFAQTFTDSFARTVHRTACSSSRSEDDTSEEEDLQTESLMLCSDRELWRFQNALGDLRILARDPEPKTKLAGLTLRQVRTLAAVTYHLRTNSGAFHDDHLFRLPNENERIQFKQLVFRTVDDVLREKSHRLLGTTIVKYLGSRRPIFDLPYFSLMDTHQKLLKRLPNRP